MSRHRVHFGVQVYTKSQYSKYVIDRVIHAGHYFLLYLLIGLILRRDFWMFIIKSSPENIILVESPKSASEKTRIFRSRMTMTLVIDTVSKVVSIERGGLFLPGNTMKVRNRLTRAERTKTAGFQLLNFHNSAHRWNFEKKRYISR